MSEYSSSPVSTASSIMLFEVGRLVEFSDCTLVPNSKILEKLLAFDCFTSDPHLDIEYLNVLSTQVDFIINRVNEAINGIITRRYLKEELWSKLYEEPRNSLGFARGAA